jgi:hypothetical protein
MAVRLTVSVVVQLTLRFYGTMAVVSCVASEAKILRQYMYLHSLSRLTSDAQVLGFHCLRNVRLEIPKSKN